ncbi:MAG: hypothetical protein QOF98_1595 [Streptomyces sp.]|nr:hypothetical protein [Streptomyces sp.]
MSEQVPAQPDPDPAAARRELAAELNRAILAEEKRLGRGIGRIELARRLHVSKGSLYAYLNGTTLPPSGTFELLLRELHVTGGGMGHLGTLRDRAEVAQRVWRGDHRTRSGLDNGRTAPADPPAPPAPRQLPSAHGNFVGRGAELGLLDDLLAEAADEPGAAAVVVIDGTAGVGKTTLALEWSHRVKARFPDGQLYVDLRGFDPQSPMEAAEALRGFLHALGVVPGAVPPEPDGRAGLLRTLLARRRMLVVLDNAGSADTVRPLLPGGSDSLVLVTSRNRLDSLAVRDGARRVTLDVLPQPDALDLLGARAPSGRLAAEPAAADELVRQCAGLPLALSIAAARLAVGPTGSLEDFVAELRDLHQRLDMLASGEADLDLRTVFQWSYDKLPAAAARLFRLLGTHPGPDIDGYACAALLGAEAPSRRALGALTAAHLVAERTPGRFGFHDLLRVYAQGLADRDDPADRAAATWRVLDHYLDGALLANRHIQPCRTAELPHAAPVSAHPLPEIASYAQAMTWFAQETATLRAVLGQAVAQGFDSHVWRLAWACNVFLRRSGLRTERVLFQRLALDAAVRAGDRAAAATSMRLLADGLARTGREPEALDLLRSSLAECEALGDDDGMLHAHLSYARVHESEQRYGEALAHAESALRLADRGGDLLARADGLTAVGRQQALLGRWGEVLPLGERALRLYERLGYGEGEADVLMNIGYAELHLGLGGPAIAHLERSLALDRELGDRYWEARALDRLADAHAAMGDRDRSRQRREQALALLESLYHPEAEAVRVRLKSDMAA